MEEGKGADPAAVAAALVALLLAYLDLALPEPSDAYLQDHAEDEDDMQVDFVDHSHVVSQQLQQMQFTVYSCSALTTHSSPICCLTRATSRHCVLSAPASVPCRGSSGVACHMEPGCRLLGQPTLPYSCASSSTGLRFCGRASTLAIWHASSRASCWSACYPTSLPPSCHPSHQKSCRQTLTGSSYLLCTI